METKVGRVALITREFTVAEILELRPEGPTLAGYSIFGRPFGATKVYPSKDAALAAAKHPSGVIAREPAADEGDA
jgi:hypothetical protein